MALPALWSLRALWPDARFTLLTKRTPLAHVVVADAVFEGTGVFDAVVEYPGARQGGDSWAQRWRQLRLLFTLRRRGFDALVYLAPSERQPAQVQRDKRFFRLAGIGQLIGFDHIAPPPSRQAVPLPTLPIEAEALLARLRVHGLAVPPLAVARRDCALGTDDHAFVEQWLARQDGAAGSRRWLALAPGSNMPAKIWPLARYAAVAAVLMREHALWPVVFGGPEDRSAGEALIAQLGAGYNAAGELPLRAAAAAMRHAALYLGNDTGTMHLAASEGVPCVAPFAARDFPGKWHPMGNGHELLRRRPPCEGCMLERCEARQMACLLEIDSAEVLAAAQRVLARAKA